jgi:hypothetical protein
MMQRKLSRQEFRDALRKGLGRAVLHVRSFGLRQMGTEITSAMNRRLAYDAQCEQGRGRFLWTVIQAAKAESDFRQIVVRKLATGLKRDHYVTAQLCELAGRYAASGDTGIKEALYALFERSLATDSLLADEEIIDADGLEGFERMASMIGREALSRKLVCDYSAQCVFGSVRKVDRRKARGILRRKDAELAAFKRTLAVETGRRKRRKLPKPPSWRRVRAEIERRSSRAVLLARRFGKVASKADRTAALDYALSQTDPARASKALMVFSTSPLPHYDPRLRVLASSRYTVLRNRTFNALATISDPEVRRLALESLQKPRWLSSGGIGLFAKNYRDEDGARIDRAIATFKTEGASHTAALDLRDVVERKWHRSLVPAVVRACIQSPCGLCRASLFKSLCAAKAAPAWMIGEFLLDTDDDTRLLASRASKRR